MKFGSQGLMRSTSAEGMPADITVEDVKRADDPGAAHDTISAFSGH
jgi:hypothetical protein